MEQNGSMTQTIDADAEEKRITSPIKAIRAKCLECSCESPYEVRMCPIEDCALYPFRFGKNPYVHKREYTDEEREAMAARLAEARAKKKS